VEENTYQKYNRYKITQQIRSLRDKHNPLHYRSVDVPPFTHLLSNLCLSHKSKPYIRLYNEGNNYPPPNKGPHHNEETYEMVIL